MRRTAVAMLVISCLILPACSGSGGGSSTGESSATGEPAPEQTEPAAAESTPPEIVMEVIKTVSD